MKIQVLAVPILASTAIACVAWFNLPGQPRSASVSASTFATPVVDIGKSNDAKQTTILSATGRTRLGMVRLESGMAGRWLIERDGYSFLAAQLPPRFRSRSEVNAALAGDPNRSDDDLKRFIESPRSRWHIAANKLGDMTTFNCVTYALGQAAGLTKADWVEPSPTYWTNGASPAEAILKHEYRLISSSVLREGDELELSDLKGLQTSDVVAFVDSHQRSRYLHFAVVKNVDGKRVLVGKLGEGPIAYGTLQQTVLRFDGDVNQILVYRRRAT